jgi:hypothetical protein
VAQHEGKALLVTEVGEPVPGKHALTGDGQSLAERADSAEEGLGAGGEGLLEDDVASGVEDAQGECPGVQIDATIESVGLIVESHHGLRSRGCKWLYASVPFAKRP